MTIAARSGGSDSGYLPEPFVPLLPCAVPFALPPELVVMSVGVAELVSVATVLPVDVVSLLGGPLVLAVPALARAGSAFAVIDLGFLCVARRMVRCALRFACVRGVELEPLEWAMDDDFPTDEWPTLALRFAWW